MEECIPITKSSSNSKVIKLLILSKPSPDKDSEKKKKSTPRCGKSRKIASDNQNNDEQSITDNKLSEKKIQNSAKKKTTVKKIKLDNCETPAEENNEDLIQNKLERALEDILYSRQMEFFRSPEVIEILQNLTKKQM